MERHQLEQNPATTVGLVYGFFGGAILIAAAWSLIPNGTVPVADNAINYVELDPSTGTVSANVIGFDAARIPMAKVATMDGEVASVSDWRPAFIPGAKGDPGQDGADGTNGQDGVDGTNGTNGVDGEDGAPGESGILHGDGAPTDGVTGLGSSTKIYQNDTPSEETTVLYVNIDPANPSTNPQWRGLNIIGQ